VSYSELEKLLSVFDGGGFVIQELSGYNSSKAYDRDIKACE
jgi:hypothetical protein